VKAGAHLRLTALVDTHKLLDVAWGCLSCPARKSLDGDQRPTLQSSIQVLTPPQPSFTLRWTHEKLNGVYHAAVQAASCTVPRPAWGEHDHVCSCSICGNVIRQSALMGCDKSNMLQMTEPILVQVAPFSLHCSSKATIIQHAIHE